MPSPGARLPPHHTESNPNAQLVQAAQGKMYHDKCPHVCQSIEQSTDLPASTIVSKYRISTDLDADIAPSP